MYGICEGNSGGGYKTARRQLAQLRLKSGHDKMDAGHWKAAENEYMEAMGILRSVSNADKDLEDDMDLIAGTFYKLGWVCLYQKRLVKAEQMIKAAMGQYPKDHPEQIDFIELCWRALVPILTGLVKKFLAEGNKISAAEAQSELDMFVSLISGGREAVLIPRGSVETE
ncbi:hypothetical protein D3C84_816380 [compost metagenome]